MFTKHLQKIDTKFMNTEGDTKLLNKPWDARASRIVISGRKAEWSKHSGQ